MIDHQHVLTAAHCADGVGHRVSRPGVNDDEWLASVVVTSSDPVIDLAILRVEQADSSDLREIEQLPRAVFADVDSERVSELNGCIAVGFPKWKPSSPEGFRNPAQFSGSVLTGEFQRRRSITGVDVRLFAVKSNRFNDVTRPRPMAQGVNRLAPSTPRGDLEATAWAGISGAAVIDSEDNVIGVIRSHNASEGVASLTFTTVASVDALDGTEKQAFRELLRVGPSGRWRNAGSRQVSAWSTVDSDNYTPITFASAQVLAPSIHQLPPAIDDFTGRSSEIRSLSKLIETEHSTRIIVNIFGLPGVGKSALALHMAHLVSKSSRSDVQLYANLGEQDGRLPNVEEVLQQFIAALDPATMGVPIATAQLAGRYRSMLANVRSLVLLDDAQASDQIAGLLPATDYLTAIITSRTPLASVPGVVTYHLNVLDDRESAALLLAVSGRDTQREDLSQIMQLVGQCGRLPLALRIAGAILKRKKHWQVARLLRSLEDEGTRLAKLVEGSLDVRTCFSISYSQLNEATARAFRLLAILPLPAFNLKHATVMLAKDAVEADELIETLVDAQLVEIVDNETYSLHDLLRLYGKEAAGSAEADEADERLAAFISELTGDFLSEYASCLLSNAWVVRRQGYAHWETRSEPIDADQLYVMPRLASDDGGSASRNWPSLFGANRLIWISAAGGMGKTTFAERMCYEVARGDVQATEQVDVGFVIPLRLVGSTEHLDVQRLLISAVRLKQQLTVSEEAIELLLYTRRVLIVFDGFDEIPAVDRDATLAALVEFSERFTNLKVVLTGRPDAYAESALMRRFERFSIAALDDEAIDEHIQSWAKALSQPDMYAATFAKEMRSLGREWLSSPLLLTQLMALYEKLGRLPRRQVDLYNVMYEAFFGAREVQRGITRLSKLEPHYFGALLASLTYQFKVRSGFSARGVPDRDMRAFIISCFQNWHHPFSPAEVQNVASDLAALNLPVYRTPGVEPEELEWQVSRDPFSEYLAARWIIAESTSSHLEEKLSAIVRAVGFRLGCIFSAQLAGSVGSISTFQVVSVLKRLVNDRRLSQSVKAQVEQAIEVLE